MLRARLLHAGRSVIRAKLPSNTRVELMVGAVDVVSLPGDFHEGLVDAPAATDRLTEGRVASISRGMKSWSSGRQVLG